MSKIAPVETSKSVAVQSKCGTIDTMQDAKGKGTALTGGNRVSMMSMRKKKTQLTNPKKFIEHVQAKHPSKNFEEGCCEWYKKLYIESPSFINYLKPGNREKNEKVWLCDSTRVTLDDPNFYYHASYITGSKGSAEYVMAQAPTTDMKADFMKMLSYLKPDGIVLMEAVEELASEMKADKTKEIPEVKKFLMTIDGKKDVKVAQFANFDINSKPNNRLVTVHENIRSYIGWNTKGLVVVVCGDGATKSSIFTIYDIETLGLKNKGKIKLGECIRTVRGQRMNSIETKESYEFVILWVLEMCRTKIGKK